MRESELEKVGAALSSMPARAGQTVAVGAAAVSFITSSAVMGDLTWYAALDARWQIAVLCLAGTQIFLVVTALVLTLTVAPPDAVGLYQGPARTETVVRERPWWEFWRPSVELQQDTVPPPKPIGFADEAQERILSTAGSGQITQTHVDEYMAMIAFLQASEDSALLHMRRRTILTAARCVSLAAVCAGVVLIIAAASRFGLSTMQGNQSADKNVIIDGRTPHANHQFVPQKPSQGGSTAPAERRNSGGIQRQGVRPSRPSNPSRSVGGVNKGH